MTPSSAPIMIPSGTKKCYSNTFTCMVDDVVDIDAPGERVLVKLDDGLLVDMPETMLDVVVREIEDAGATSESG